MFKIVPLDAAQDLPVWRRPIVLLVLMAVAMPLCFYTWFLLINNFIVEAAGFDGSDTGWLHSLREIPGFLAVGVIYVLYFMREQVLGVVSLGLLAIGTAVAALSPSMAWILSITLLSSIGFHYYETVNQSLQLQWLPKDRAPKMLGRLVGVGSAVTLIVYVVIYFIWKPLGLSFNTVFLAAGGLGLLIVLVCAFAFPQFESPTPQRKEFVLRRRYWLYYALQFMSGARRQIFMVFAPFMMVEYFGFQVQDMALLYIATHAVNMVLAPVFGSVITRFGERNTLAFEYVGLVLVFAAYGGIYFAGWGVVLAVVLYILDHIFFALAFALKTYFQKIADPGDIAPTAAVAFTINHIAAVFLPALLGYLWIVSPGGVFVLAAGMAATSLTLALMIPRHPVPGHETIFARGGSAAPEPAE